MVSANYSIKLGVRLGQPPRFVFLMIFGCRPLILLLLSYFRGFPTFSSRFPRLFSCSGGSGKEDVGMFMVGSIIFFRLDIVNLLLNWLMESNDLRFNHGHVQESTSNFPRCFGIL
ncbi:unnamed protein product [Linum trigynum]|uniref:Uncharacterized protein n=1 Tax=Linum trigynum TaxID=586398 RepID=A0AAV2F573_9ROSI